jgi:hypothetical protein
MTLATLSGRSQASRILSPGSSFPSSVMSALFMVSSQ